MYSKYNMRSTGDYAIRDYIKGPELSSDTV